MESLQTEVCPCAKILKLKSRRWSGLTPLSFVLRQSLKCVCWRQNFPFFTSTSPSQRKMLCGWIMHEIARPTPDVFKVLKTYDEPVDFFFQPICWVAPEDHLTVSLGRGTGNVWNIIPYSAGKIRIRLLLFHALLFSLFQIHLALSTPTIVDTFWSFWAAMIIPLVFIWLKAMDWQQPCWNFTAKRTRSESLRWARSVFPRDLELEQRARESNCLCPPIQASMPGTTTCGLGSCGWASLLHHVEWGAEMSFCWDQI